MQPRRAAGRILPHPIPPKPAPAGDNSPGPADVWFQDPVPLPEPQRGPGLFVLTEEYLRGKPDLAAAYSLFRRYLLEHRTGLELPLALLLDANGHAVKLYYAAAPPAAGRIESRRPSALPYPGRAIGQPRRDYFKLGAALIGSGYGDYALPYLELDLRRDPDNLRTLVLSAQVLREMGKLDAASERLDRALQRDPLLAEARNEAGGIALARNRLDEALAQFTRALEAKPDLLYALLNAAQTAGRLPRPADAGQFYRRAVAAHPRSAEAASGLGLNNLAVLYVRTKRERDAERALETGIGHAPAEESLYLNLGRLYVQAGGRERARATMRRLLAAKPGSAVARRALADLEK